MFDGWSEKEKEVFSIIALLAGFGAGGAFSIGVFYKPLETWLIDQHILVAGTDLLVDLPWSTDVGLDLPRVIIGVCIVLALLAGLVFLVIALRRRHAEPRG